MSDYDIGKAFEEIENELISSMIRNLSRHRVEESKLGIEWSQWQAEQLKALEVYKRKNSKKFTGQYNSINQHIRRALQDSYNDGGTKQERQILQAVKRGFKGEKKPTFTGVAETTGEFFKTNERKLNSLIKATTHDMKKAEIAVLRMANDQYRKVIFNAQVMVNTGAGTYAKAVDMATKDFLSAGINCIQYRNGRRVNIKSYAEMALRTANKRAYLQGEGAKRQEWGIYTVILNKRGNPCPLCAPFVGKVFIDDVWSGGPKDGISPVTGIKYPLLSEAIKKGLYHPNCKDAHTTYFEGISTPPENSQYTADELDELAEKYKISQHQNFAQNEAERMERMSKFSLDKDNKRAYGARAEQWKKKAEELEKDIYNEAESSKPKIVNPNSVVDKQIIDSSNYRKMFDKLGENSKTTRSIFQQAKAILNHRSGSDFEDLSFIDSITGKFLTRTDYSVERQCIPSKQMMDMVKKAKPNTIIAIHNHPNSSVPSLDDINSAWKKKYKYGIIACHNGNIFKYRVLGGYNQNEVNFILDKLNRELYNNKKDDMKINDILGELKINNIEMEVFLWK
ncbi:MAG: phage minor capsid protein [Candidatus Pseudoruminococcus sp.]|nr:phage minor capsid protein [Ruminococcus sp.]MDY2782002.1 phage minor capsid protein [Candidatus Pseudoruminococcus sp.]